MGKAWLRKAGITAAVLMLLSATGCKMNATSISEQEVALAPSWREESLNKVLDDNDKRNIVYEKNNFCIIDDLGRHSINKFGTRGDRIFTSVLNAEPGDDYHYSSYTNRQYDLEGNVIAEYTKDYVDHLQPTFVTIDEQGRVFSVMVEYAYNEKTCESVTKRTLITVCTEKGDPLWTLDMGTDVPEGEDYRIHDLELTDDMRIAVASSKGIELVNMDGSYSQCIPTDGREAFRLIPVKNGNLLMFSPVNSHKFEEEMNVYEVDLLAGRVNPETVKLPFPVTGSNCSGGSDTDLIISYGDYLYSYDIDTDKQETLIDFKLSELSVLNANEIAALQDGCYFTTAYSWDSTFLNGRILQNKCKRLIPNH